ncbi:efflux RND transporter permease subunit [Pantoea ananatis]|uniref:efflux RND transporter permease subunit n=1 Tax=Pantoea ananas TaxID=553 RepID=UPI0039B8841D
MHAAPALPGDQVQRLLFEVVAFTSDDGSMDNFDVANYMESNIDDQISRVSGVGNMPIPGEAAQVRADALGRGERAAAWTPP